jgi:hypothetical protein
MNLIVNLPPNLAVNNYGKGQPRRVASRRVKRAVSGLRLVRGPSSDEDESYLTIIK